MEKIDLEEAARTMELDCFLRMVGNMEAEEKMLETSLKNLEIQINVTKGSLQELQKQYATLSEQYQYIYQSLHPIHE